MPKHIPVQPSSWVHLRAFIDICITLGRAGNSQTTNVVPTFDVARVRAHDAVYLLLDSAMVAAALEEVGFLAVATHSVAVNRAEYPRRPDPGRYPGEASRVRLGALWPAQPFDVVFAIVDGLSVSAVYGHAVSLLCSVHELLPAGWLIEPAAIAEQSRVALGDETGVLLGAWQVVMLIDERPGLSSPDSLGIYLTHAPCVGRSDAERNYISNVRSAGQAYNQATTRLVYLFSGALALSRSGVNLKDDTSSVSPGATRLAEPHNP